MPSLSLLLSELQSACSAAAAIVTYFVNFCQPSCRASTCSTRSRDKQICNAKETNEHTNHKHTYTERARFLFQSLSVLLRLRRCPLSPKLDAVTVDLSLLLLLLRLLLPQTMRRVSSCGFFSLSTGSDRPTDSAETNAEEHTRSVRRYWRLAASTWSLPFTPNERLSGTESARVGWNRPRYRSNSGSRGSSHSLSLSLAGKIKQCGERNRKRVRVEASDSAEGEERNSARRLLADRSGCCFWYRC